MDTNVELTQNDTDEMLPEYDFSKAVRGKYACRRPMTHDELLARIEINPQIMVGKPVVRGTRLTVQHLLGLMANGASSDEILGEYQRLTPEDLQACLLFAGESQSSP